MIISKIGKFKMADYSKALKDMVPTKGFDKFVSGEYAGDCECLPVNPTRCLL